MPYIFVPWIGTFDSDIGKYKAFQAKEAKKIEKRSKKIGVCVQKAISVTVESIIYIKRIGTGKSGEKRHWN